MGIGRRALLDKLEAPPQECIENIADFIDVLKQRGPVRPVHINTLGRLEDGDQKSIAGNPEGDFGAKKILIFYCYNARQ